MKNRRLGRSALNLDQANYLRCKEVIRKGWSLST